ncbi:MAG TPA: hypothetical protein VGM20_05805 [Gemmatimonadales bacterium]
MHSIRLAAVGAIVLAAAACSSEPVVNPGTPGAGVATAIAGVDHDSSGYTVHFTMTNHDTADVGFGACEGAVQELTPDGWKTVTNWGQCALVLGMLPPTQSMSFSIPGQPLTPGATVRVVVGWSFVFSHGTSNESLSAPITVP